MKQKNRKMLKAALQSIDLNRIVNVVESSDNDAVLAATLTRLKNEVTYLWELATDNTAEDKHERMRNEPRGAWD